MQRLGSTLKRLYGRLGNKPSLFPPIEPFSSFHLQVGSPHELYVEQCGNKEGIPVVFLHGGPGAGCNPFNRRFFDPRRYHIILFDQRGAGRSRPYASLENNTTQDLVDDMEAIRKKLGIDRWLLFGGSWGSTLALVYAQTYPERVLGIVARGIFLCRPREIDWFYQEGASRVFPDHWEGFADIIPEDERSDMLSAYYKRLTDDDQDISTGAAIAWSIWEGQASTLRPSPSQTAYFSDPKVALCMSRIECHYFKHAGFLAENQIISNAHLLKGIPGTIVHGRYDLICPLESAWELNAAWQEAELQIIADAGHSAAEPGTSSALVAATNKFAELL